MRLARGVALVVWDAAASAPTGRRLRVSVGGQTPPAPFARTELALADGRRRNVLALRQGDADAGPIVIRDGDGTVVVGDDDDDGRIAAGAGPLGPWLACDFDAAQLLDGAGAAGRARFARFVLDVCASLFGLGCEPSFVASCREMLAELSPAPARLVGRAAVLADYALCEARLPVTLGTRIEAVVIGASVRRADFAPGQGETGPRSPVRAAYLLLDRAQITKDACVVFLGDGGVACRRLSPPCAELPPVIGWLAGAPGRGGQARRYLIECLAGLPAENRDAAALVRALALIGPAGAAPGSGERGTPVEAGIDLLLGCEAGLVIAGWLHDPAALAAAIEVEGTAQVRSLAIGDLGRFARTPRGPADAAVPVAAQSNGFMALLRAPGRPQAWLGRSVALGLPSGHRLALAGVPAVLPPAAARDAVLACLGEASLPARLVEDHVEPVLRALDAELGRSAADTPGEVIAIGAAAPRAKVNAPALSVIVSLAEDEAIVRCQLALLAIDGPAADAELLLVAAGAGLAPSRRAALSDLVTAYGLSARLVIPAAGATETMALNAAAGLVRAPLMAFLGAGVVPEAPGWLARLAGFLVSHRECTIVGARLIDADQALRHAGADISIDDGGAWAVTPRFRGFPRDFLPAALTGPIPVVSRQCLVTRTAFFAQHGGFSHVFLSALYADADLCFKARHDGGVVWHLSEPALFVLDGGGCHGPTAGQTAALLDRRSLARLWRDRLQEPPPPPSVTAASVTARAAPAPAAVAAAAPAKAPRKRRRRQEVAA